MALGAALKSALVFENRIRDLHLEAVAGTDDAAGKKIFQDLADDEQNQSVFKRFHQSVACCCCPGS